MHHQQDSSSSGAHISEQSTAMLDVSIIWRRKWSLLACLAITTGLGGLYLSQAERIYESEMRVLVQPDVLSEQEELREDEFFLATQAEVIWSPVTVREAIHEVPGAIGADGATATVLRVLTDMRVTPLEDTNVLKIGLRDTNPVRSHRLLQAIIAAYSEHVRSAEVGRRTETTRILTEQEQQISDELEKLRAEFRRNRELNPLVGHGADALAIQLGSLKGIGEELAESRKLRMEAENLLRITQQLPPRKLDEGLAGFPLHHLTKAEVLHPPEGGDAIAANSSDVLASFLVPDKLALPMETDPIAATQTAISMVRTGNPQTINESLMNAQSEATRLAQFYGPKHPALSGIHKQVEWWNKCLEASKREAAIVANQQVEVMKATEQSLGDLYAMELQAAKELDSHIMAEKELQSRIDQLEERHQQTLTALNSARTTEEALRNGDSPVRVRVLEGSEFIASKVWPQPVPFLAVCALIGLMGGCIVISLGEQLRLKSSAATAGNAGRTAEPQAV